MSMKRFEGNIKSITDTPFGYTLTMIGGKWRLVILYWLVEHGVVRFNELQRLIGGITYKTLSAQLKEMEAVRVAKRKTDIQALYDSVIGEMLEYLPLEKIYDPKWENASVKLPAVKKAMIELIGKVYEEVTTIKNMDSEVVPKALEMYKRDLSLANAVRYINNYESQRLEILRREEEKKRDLEIERIRREERERVAQEQQIREETRRETVDELKSVDESLAGVWPVAPEAKKVIYTVLGTESELEELETALNSLGLYFERKDV